MKADEQSDYGETWYAGTTPLPPSRPSLSYDIDVDLCVIGGGLAGLTVAREAARRGWSVALLEARRVAWSASGRNGGVVLPGFSAPVEKIVERVGLPAAKALWALSQSGVAYIRDAVAEMGEAGITGLVEGHGRLDVSKYPDRACIHARVDLLAEMGVGAERWSAERIRETLRSRHYFEAIHFPAAFQINPLAYAQGLAAAAARAGARIYENTPATAVDLAGIRKRIDTPRARVRAGHVVLAGNVHLGGIVRSLADTLVPVTAWTGVTPPLGKPLAEAIAFHGAVSSLHEGGDHYRIVGHDRLMWTGAATGGALLARPVLERTIRATFPQLGVVRFEHFWTVRTGYAVHRMPQIGKIDRGVWIASAFGGHGLNTSALAGELIARAIVDRDDTWQRFLPFDLVWAGGRTGRAVAGLAAWWQRRSDAARALAARQHEEFQNRRREKSGNAKAAGKIPAGGIASITLLAGSGPLPALKRVLKLARTDRPGGATEAAPAARPVAEPAGPGSDGATRRP